MVETSLSGSGEGPGRATSPAYSTKIFREDERPWFESGEDAPQGAVVVMLLRRIAYNLLALFRSVTQRSEDKRQIPWRDLLRWVYNTLIAATASDLDGLRGRATARSGT